MWQPCVSEKSKRLLIFQTFFISLTQKHTTPCSTIRPNFWFREVVLILNTVLFCFVFKQLLLLIKLLIKEFYSMCQKRQFLLIPRFFSLQSSICPRNGVCGYSVLSFQTHKEPSIWGDSGGEHFHADSETSRMTPVWRCHAWLWKGKNNASLEKGEKSLVQSQF